MDYHDLNGRERGETVFIIGAGPQLGLLPDDVLAALSDRPTIGVNLTQYRVRPRYFLSSYAEQHILARHRAPDAIQIHVSDVYGPPVLDYLLVLKRQLFEPETTLPPALAGPEPALVTKGNICLAATHLALVFGAKAIVYVGVEQENSLHFYHMNPAAREAIDGDIEILRRYDHIPREFKYRTYHVVRDLLEADPAVLAETPFVARQEALFAEYFRQLGEFGISVFSSTSSGVAIDAGAAYLPIDQCLALSP